MRLRGRGALLSFKRLPKRAHALVVLVALALVASPLLAGLGAGVPSSDKMDFDGFEGVAGRPVVPVARATLVAFDPSDLADDLAYLAAVPASTFWYDAGGVQVQSPLLFYQPPMGSPSPEETALDAGRGVESFMGDYVTACGGKLASMTTIGIPASEAATLQGKWSAQELVAIPGGQAAATAARIAKANWEWSETAVVAVVDPAVAPFSVVTEGTLSGTLPPVAPRHGAFTGSIEPSFHSQVEHTFDVPEEYRYISSVLDWGTPDPMPGFIQRGKELGFHLYDGDVMVALSTEWNALSGAVDRASSFIFSPGSWKAVVVYIPTMGLPGSDVPETADRLYTPADYTLAYDLYGGVDVPVPDVPAYGARDAVFTLTWDDPGRDLGIFLRDPSGLDLASALATGAGGTQVLEATELGSGAYTVSVVALDGASGPARFDVAYSWNTTMSADEVGGLVGASEAAVLASGLNAPLLYATPGGLPAETKATLDLLGVRKVVLVDLMGKGAATRDAIERMRLPGEPGLSVERISTFESAVARIVADARGTRERTQDIVVTTLDPWSYWYTGRDVDNPIGEEWGGRYIGPAAYAAASHACPVLVTEADSRLSCAKAWHNVYWTMHNRATVPVSAMYLTGTAVYDCIASLGLDLTGRESIVTVADQFDIGTPWDRALVGPGIPGRIMGTPVDAGYWVCRGAMYPLVIFANPGVDPLLDPTSGVRIVGSTSRRVLGELRTVQAEQGIKMHAPVAFTWACYLYKFNERASEYWGAKYVARDGSIPGESSSSHPWDKGVMPDLSEDVYQTYSMQAGYGEAEAAGYDATVENLNRGCVMWIETMHGGSRGGGILGWWSDAEKEPNPRRGYEEVQGRLVGSTEDPDVVTMGKYTGMDNTPCTGPVAGFDILPERHDGVVIAYNQQSQTMAVYGPDLDADLEDIHSLGLFAGSCSISNTFLHLSLIRHGSSFQIIDPWLTSWYCELAQEVFYRDVGYGEMTVGEAYQDAISLVGSEYVTQDFWWDHWENVVFFGEPDMRVYTPFRPIPRPDVLAEDATYGGHAVMVASGHPAAVSGEFAWTALAGAGVALLAVEVYVHRFVRAPRTRPRAARRSRPAA